MRRHLHLPAHSGFRRYDPSMKHLALWHAYYARGRWAQHETKTDRLAELDALVAQVCGNDEGEGAAAPPSGGGEPVGAPAPAPPTVVGAEPSDAVRAPAVRPPRPDTKRGSLRISAEVIKDTTDV